MKKGKVYSIIVGIDILQIILGLAVLVYVSTVEYDPAYNYLIFTIGILILCGIALLVCVYTLGQSKDAYMLQNMKHLEDLNTTLRAQRHDYLNHFQVVYGLMELEEYEEARKYLAPVFKDILKVGKALKTSKPAVNALLQAKMAEAESKGIDFYLEVRSDLAEITMESWDLSKVLANILDNAIRAVCEGEAEEKKIEVIIKEDGDGYEFAIRNNGPQIPEEFQKEMFKPGLTTKKESGHGMGLYIVKGLLQDSGGEIKVTSDASWTTFNIRMKREQKGL